jgi:hypothetical protein
MSAEELYSLLEKFIPYETKDICKSILTDYFSKSLSIIVSSIEDNSPREIIPKDEELFSEDDRLQTPKVSRREDISPTEFKGPEWREYLSTLADRTLKPVSPRIKTETAIVSSPTILSGISSSEGSSKLIHKFTFKREVT